MIKLKFKSGIFESSNKSTVYKFFYIFFYFFLYQENKERLQEKLVKDVKIFLEKKKKKSNNIVVNVTKISEKMKKIN